MADTNGWVRFYRKMLDNPIICKDSDHFYLWAYLLLNATHKEIPVLFNGKKTMLQPGQLITGRKVISENTGISESKVQRILKLFKSEQQIEQLTNRHNRLITILAWNEYQQSEQQNEQVVNNQRTTSEQPVNTNKNVKNEKKVRSKERKSIYEDLPIQLIKPIEDFIENRKALKKPMTDKAIELMLKKLNELSGGSTETSIKILEQSIRNGWIGIFELKDKKVEDPYIKIMREEVLNEQARNNQNHEIDTVDIQGLLQE